MNGSRRQAVGVSVGAFLAKCLSGQNNMPPPSTSPYDLNRLPIAMGGPSTIDREAPKDLAQHHKSSLDDLDKLARMVKQLREDLERAGPFTLPTNAVKGADQIQRLAKRVYDYLKLSS